jgi:hypothetical protein
MKQFISNSIDIYERVTIELPLHYICGNNIYSKEDVIIDYHPLDNMIGKLHLHIVPFYN